MVNGSQTGRTGISRGQRVEAGKKSKTEVEESELGWMGEEDDGGMGLQSIAFGY